MAVANLVAELLSIADKNTRRDWLETHRRDLDLAVMEGLKVEADNYKLRDPRRASDIVEAAFEAASFSSEPLALALAHWAKGNVLMYTGDFPACAEAYQAAEAVYAAQGDSLSVARLQSNRVFALTSLGQATPALALAEVARHGLLAAGHGAGYYMAILEMNIGVACRQADRYPEALAAYERGRAIFERLGDAVQVARMDINRAKVLEKLDRFRQAGALLEGARATLLAHGVALDVARSDLNLAELAFRCGHYRQALETYARAREGFAALGNDMEMAAIDYHSSQVYLTLNLFAEAHDLAGQAHQAFAQRGMTRFAAQATACQAAAARGQGDVKRALALFDEARAVLHERGEILEVSFLDLHRVALLRQSGQLQAALDTAISVVETMQSYGLSIRLAQARLAVADCLLDMKRIDEAGPLYRVVLQFAEAEAWATLAYHAHYGLGRIAESAGDGQSADEHYRQAVAHLEAIQQDLRLDEFQAGFMDDKLGVYEAAVRLALRRGDVATAFDYVERSRAGALFDLLAHGLELSNTEAEDAELLARLQALREEWHWRTSHLEGQDVGGSEADALGKVDQPLRSREKEDYEALRGVEQRLSQVWRQVRLRTPELGMALAGRRLTLAEVQARLTEQTALLEYYAVDGALLAFLVSHGGCEIVELGAGLDEVERCIGNWRFDLDSLRLLRPELSPTQAANLEAGQRLLLQQLYRALFAPMAERLALYTRLIVVPHRALHHLPLAALHDGQDYLAGRFQISCLPGASLLELSARACKGSPDLAGTAFPLIMAHSDGGRLPHTLHEARGIAGVLEGAVLLLEAEASQARLRQHGPNCRLLHLASHGAFRADNPLFSWLSLADARLTVHDVYTLALPGASLVTLSGCETGLGGLRGGDVLGLSHAFLAAGARSLLLSLWAVDDVSTAYLMATFYRQLAAGQCKAAALQAAQRAVRREYPHPFYWAGFVLVGADDKLTSEYRPASVH